MFIIVSDLIKMRLATLANISKCHFDGLLCKVIKKDEKSYFEHVKATIKHSFPLCLLMLFS